MNKILWASAILVVGMTCAAFSGQWDHRAPAPALWQTRLASDLERIEAGFEGEVGVFARRLKDGGEFHHATGTPWYLASTIKVFVAASLLDEVERGRIRLTEKIRLRRSDFVDGSGQVIWKKPGEVVTVEYLLEQMLTQSDSTATDMLIRRIGEGRLAEFMRAHVPGVAPITTILDVRYHAYGEAHPRAKRLTNMDFISFKQVPPARRLGAFAKKIRVRPGELKVSSVEEAFERYYRRGLNSGSLVEFGLFIERLLTGKILSAESTRLVRGLMETAVTGKNRIQAGLPSGYKFAQKTGTQIGRMCNVGLITPVRDGAEVVVTVCAQHFKSHASGELVFRHVGEALSRSGAFAN